ncbi:MAG: holin family protein [Pseudomonadota bacterium]
MGVIETLLGTIFGGGRNVVKETAEVFRVNAEAQAGRNSAYAQAALQQFAAEFQHPKKSFFDRLIDGLNRIPRPAMAIGVLGLMVAAMVDPIWFASRMQGIALVPEPLWWLLGAVVSFYFGARHQAKGQDFQRSIAATMAAAPVVTQNISALEALNAGAEQTSGGNNPALDAWRQGRDG